MSRSIVFFLIIIGLLSMLACDESFYVPQPVLATRYMEQNGIEEAICAYHHHNANQSFAHYICVVPSHNGLNSVFECTKVSCSVR